MDSEQQRKYIAVVCMLPLMADYLEDLMDVKLKRELKQLGNTLIHNTRRFDDVLMKTADIEAIEQQNEVQRAMRQWVVSNIKVEES